MKTNSELSINDMVKKHLKNNDDVIKANDNLRWVMDLLNSIKGNFQLPKEIEKSQGTVKSECGYNLSMMSAKGDLYFRVEPNGVEFKNDGVIYESCTEELVKKVVDYCNKKFLRGV